MKSLERIFLKDIKTAIQLVKMIVFLKSFIPLRNLQKKTPVPFNGKIFASLRDKIS